jgi:oxaloacetate decarboxylase alpha subunit
MLKACGKVPLELHSHCMTGLAPLVYLEGVKLGVTQIQTSIAPLANGPAQPATQTVVRNLRSMGYEIKNRTTASSIQSGPISGQLRSRSTCRWACRWNTISSITNISCPAAMHDEHEISTRAGRARAQVQRCLVETARVFTELGWPAMVTPFSQLVGTQAVLNVMQGERYKTVPDEVKNTRSATTAKRWHRWNLIVLDRIIANGFAQDSAQTAAARTGGSGDARKISGHQR